MSMALVALFATSCATIEPPKVVLSGVELEGISTDGIEFRLLASVTNPNGFAADVEELDYTVEVDGTEVARGARSATVSVDAGATVDVEVPFALTWKGIEKGLDRYLDGGRHEWSLKGTATIGKGAISKTFRFSERGSFTGPDAGDLRFDL